MEHLRLRPAVIGDRLATRDELPRYEVAVRKLPIPGEMLEQIVDKRSRSEIGGKKQDSEVQRFRVVVEVAAIQREPRRNGKRNRSPHVIEQVLNVERKAPPHRL